MEFHVFHILVSLDTVCLFHFSCSHACPLNDNIARLTVITFGPGCHSVVGQVPCGADPEMETRVQKVYRGVSEHQRLSRQKKEEPCSRGRMEPGTWSQHG